MVVTWVKIWSGFWVVVYNAVFYNVLMVMIILTTGRHKKRICKNFMIHHSFFFISSNIYGTTFCHLSLLLPINKILKFFFTHLLLEALVISWPAYSSEPCLIPFSYQNTFSASTSLVRIQIHSLALNTWVIRFMQYFLSSATVKNEHALL